MAKKSSYSSSSTSSWRYLQPRYYIKRPKRLALVLIVCVSLTWILYDRKSLTTGHQRKSSGVEMDGRGTMFLRIVDDISKLKEEVTRLQNSVRQDIKDHMKDSTESTEKEDEVDKFTKDISVEDDPISTQRRDKIKDAMLHAWTSYETYAWGRDELKPQSKNGVDNFGGLGATLVDSLDTLFIMGLDDQFNRAREWVAESLSFDKNIEVSVFETTIRVMGGLLSAYDLSGDNVFLEKARDIADKLLPAWNTPSGIPYNRINLASGSTNNPAWARAEKVIKELHENFPDDGLLPIYLNPLTGTKTGGSITFGAMGDSFYEYLLKAWVQGNKTEVVTFYREMWDKSMIGLESLIKKSTPSSFVYISERLGNAVYDKMDELACFVPGMLALGSSNSGPGEAEKYISLAEEDMTVGTSWNIQRPETIESLFYLWRFTGNKTYQEWGWDIFQAFENNSRMETGYVGLKDVTTGTKDNMMQSYFLSETLKYLYLLFSPSSVISLDEWVFNTEAHPLRIMTRISNEESGDPEEVVPRHLHGRKEGRIEYK
ncbi:hypothetical protein ACSQ67_006572 [Phaseolus vulgaris]